MQGSKASRAEAVPGIGARSQQRAGTQCIWRSGSQQFPASDQQPSNPTNQPLTLTLPHPTFPLRPATNTTTPSLFIATVSLSSFRSLPLLKFHRFESPSRQRPAPANLFRCQARRHLSRPPPETCHSDAIPFTNLPPTKLPLFAS
jgi:hypothetical protein